MSHDPWDDDRLTAAFAERARSHPTPTALTTETLDTVRARRPAGTGWRRLLAPAAVVVLAVGAVTGGLGLMRSLGGAGQVQFRDGPSVSLRTLDAGEFTFDFPADWLAYVADAPFSGGSSIAVLGTQPVEARCGNADHVDINCVYEQPLEPGKIRVFIGTGAYRGGSVLDRPDIDNGTTTRLAVGGMPAILDTYATQPDSFYREDVSLEWSIGRPATITNVVRIELLAREWPFRGRINTTAEVQAAVQVMIDSFRFTPPPVPLPSDPGAATAAARAAIEAAAASFRSGYVGDTDTAAVTYLECLGDEPDVETRATARYGPGGDLGRPVDLRCSWSIDVEASTIWRLRLTYDWSADGTSGRYTETLWIDAGANVLATAFAGDPPPAPRSEPGPAEVSGLGVISVTAALEVRDAGADVRELAVRGWFSPIGPISCPAPATWPVSPVEPNCPDQWVVLMAEPESLVTITDSGFEGRQPTGAFFQIDLDDLDSAWQPGLPELGPAEPVEVIVVGHFDDRRSAVCPAEVLQACRDRFVVDRVDWVTGTQQPLSVVDLLEGDQASTRDEVNAIVENEAPQSPILSVAIVDGPTGLGRIEPALGTGRGGLIDQRAIWAVRVLESDRSVTYLVVDGSDAIYEMSEDGKPNLVGGTAPSPSVAPWPPAGATVVSLTNFEARRPPARVALLDLSGRVTGVREVRPDDPPLVDALGAGRVDLQPDPTVAGRYRLLWVGGICDGDMTVTIDATFEHIVIDGGRRPPCDAMGVTRQLVLDVRGVLAPKTVTTSYVWTDVDRE